MKNTKITLPKKFVVKRRKWADATWSEKDEQRIAALLDPDSKRMCCLGFLCEQAGIPRKELDDVGAPKNLNGYSFSAKDNKLFDTAIGINDDSQITRKEREVELIALFGKAGCKIVFE